MVRIHIIDVGMGNMQLIVLPDRSVYVYDCNITEDNEEAVLSYVEHVIGRGASIVAFINSHRDANHVRGIKKLHQRHRIDAIWDSGVAGATATSTEYLEYMELRGQVESVEIEARSYREFDGAVFRFLNSQWADYAAPEDQSIVLKVEGVCSSAMLCGDTSYRPWMEKILPYYSDDMLGADILLASHHGSLTFFDDPSDEKRYYTAHIKKVAPVMTLVSVGANGHGLPDDAAMKLYTKNSSGSSSGSKVWTTQDKGSMLLTLKDAGGWNISPNQRR